MFVNLAIDIKQIQSIFDLQQRNLTLSRTYFGICFFVVHHKKKIVHIHRISGAFIFCLLVKLNLWKIKDVFVLEFFFLKIYKFTSFELL